MKPGDTCIFTGSLIVVPEIATLLKPGEKAQMRTKPMANNRNKQNTMDGITGLSNIGVKDLNFKLVFLAQYAKLSSKRFGSDGFDRNQDNKEDVKRIFSTSELKEI